MCALIPAASSNIKSNDYQGAGMELEGTDGRIELALKIDIYLPRVICVYFYPESVFYTVLVPSRISITLESVRLGELM